MTDLIFKAYDPNEPRDERGKWTEGGGGGGSGKTPSGAAKKPADAKHPGKGYSEHAWVDGKGVIHTSNVYDAQRALFEDRKVELTQLKQVSTLIKRLGETAAEMAEHGEAAPVFNLCLVSIEGTNLFCSEHKGIPRAKMPVIPAKQTKDFIKHLKSQGYDIEKSTERADHLRSTQNQIDGAKVAASMERIRKEGFYKRLVTSRDDYILDGHHTWAGQLGVDAQDNTLKGDKHVKIARVDISIMKLLEEADKWTKEHGIAKKPVGAKGDPEMTERDWDESKHPRVPAGSPEGGEFGEGGGGGGDGKTGGSNYGLVPGDAEKFRALKGEWSKINNDLLEHVDDPDGPESRAALDKLEAIVKEMHGLHADPGGPAGIGLPGGPRDVVIVGAGPGGLAASINGAAEGLDTLVVEANVVAGGQAKFSSRIENFPGFPIGVTGERLTQNMYQQAQRLGAEAKLGIRVTEMTYDAKTGLKHLTLSNGEKIDSRTVILAGGVEFKNITFPGSEGPGVIVGDGKTLAKEGTGGNVFVVGGSNGAAQAALGCAKTAEHVYLLARSPIVNSMSDYQITALRNNPKVTVIEGDSIKQLNRDDQGKPQVLETVKGERFPVKAVGAFIGSVPSTNWLPTDVPRAKGGRVPTNTELETSLPGVFAVGDMRDGAIGRIGVAVGEGQLALRQANVFLDKSRKQAESKAAKPPSDPPISELFDLDRDNPWFGQTVEDVTPLKKKKSKKSLTTYMTLREAASVLPASSYSKYYDTARKFLVAHPRHGCSINDMKIAVALEVIHKTRWDGNAAADDTQRGADPGAVQ